MFSFSLDFLVSVLVLFFFLLLLYEGHMSQVGFRKIRTCIIIKTQNFLEVVDS